MIVVHVFQQAFLPHAQLNPLLTGRAAGAARGSHPHASSTPRSRKTSEVLPPPPFLLGPESRIASLSPVSGERTAALEDVPQPNFKHGYDNKIFNITKVTAYDFAVSRASSVTGRARALFRCLCIPESNHSAVSPRVQSHPTGCK